MNQDRKLIVRALLSGAAEVTVFVLGFVAWQTGVGWVYFRERA